MTTPLIALVMILKDEAASVRRTILSCAGCCDLAVILDTGSADGTPRLAREALAEAGIPGEVREDQPFGDFSRARNLALDALGERAAYSLFLSGDETLEGGDALRAYLEAAWAAGASRGAYNLRVRLGGLALDSPRVARTASRWRYRGVTHEVLEPPPGEPPADERAPGCGVFHDASRRTPEAMIPRWERDVRLLRGVPEAERGPRWLFYLAQTYEVLGRARGAGTGQGRKDLEVAGDLYAARGEAGGWPEEAAEALRRAARTREDLLAGPRDHRWPEVQEMHLRAFAAAPHRCEPLLRLAYRWRNLEAWGLALLLARQACALPYPDRDLLPVDTWEWEYGRWELLAVVCSWIPGALEEGRRACREAERAGPLSGSLRACYGQG